MTIGKMAENLAQLAQGYADDPSDARWAELERYGVCLEGVGGLELMEKVWDTAVDRLGVGSVINVSLAWQGIGGWEA